ncbi:MAG: hypothetical protein AB7N80_08010 [Bdellovibrionales bacterium]
MRRIGDLMTDLGFNKDSDEDTQKAFIRHLVRAANVSQFQRKTNKNSNEPTQLSFDFEKAEGASPEDHLPPTTKVGNKQVG